jgi:hypothetical protein
LSTQINHPSAVFKDYLYHSVIEQVEVDLLTTIEAKKPGSTFEHPICALTFYDSKKSNFFSNIGSSQLINENCKRYRPQMIALYNMYMNNVDKANAACNLYLDKHRKSK